VRPGDRTDHKGAQLVNEPGTWNFSDLNTRDVEGAMAFYGAPPGFEDVVAGLIPMTEHPFPPEVPSHWSVTFTVDDADATAARAAELGGTVITPPFDAGPTRVAVVGDPQGAVFAVSMFDPDRL
jgi:hypothetical protein